MKTTDIGLPSPQAAELTTYISALRDQKRRLVYPGFSITDLANGGMDAWSVGAVAPTAPDSPDPWGNKGFKPAPTGFQFTDHILQYYYALDPDYDYRAFPVTPAGTATDKAIRAFDSKTSRADAGRASLYDRYIAEGRKMIWYHGLSDPALPAFRSFVLYEELAKLHHGYGPLQANMRFFAVPGMQHCGSGPGPNFFDTLGPLEAWVEHGKAPDALMAAHYPGNKPAPGEAPDRTMPLCPFPTQASHAGGDVKTAASWSCKPDTRMLDVGLDGTLAGLPPRR